jgi:LytS/YehU family sensor histidine kinase
MLQYRLEGYDEKWSLPANKRFVIYEKLPPGSYRFQLKAFNVDGVESSDQMTMGFEILPSFLQTTLFMVMAFTLLLIIIVTGTLLIMRRRLRKQKDKERFRIELSRLQMSLVLRHFDPHFTFNVISSVGSLIMKGEKEIAYEYITKLSGLLRIVLSDGSLIIKPLSDEIDFVRKYCELQKLRYKERFRFNIVIDKNVDLDRAIPKMTIQTFVENSIKHGLENSKDGGKVDIIVRGIENKLEIKILDNGIGRDAAALKMSGGTGYGLKIIDGLIKVMNANNRGDSTLEIIDLKENSVPSGTEVRITIPDDYHFEFLKN